MPMFETIPVTVEAKQNTRKKTAAEILEWINGPDEAKGQAELVRSPGWSDTHLYLWTEAGAQIIEIGDWVVKTPEGRFIRVRPLEFTALYRPIP